MGCTSSAPPPPRTTSNAPSRLRGGKFPAKYKWAPGTQLGKGNFACVKQAHILKTGELVAVKCFLREALKPDDEAAVFVEAEILARVRAEGGACADSRGAIRVSPPSPTAAPPQHHPLH